MMIHFLGRALRGFCLAALILNDLAPACPVDEDDAWSEQDYRDLSVFSMHLAVITDQLSG
jgi:hypothetical protein